MTDFPPIEGSPPRRGTDDSYPFRPAEETNIGEIYFSTAVETVIAGIGTYVKALGTTTFVTDPAPVQFTMPSNNRLTYTGTVTKKFWVSCTFSATSASNIQLLGFDLAKNGTIVADKATIQRKVGTGTDEGAGAVHGLFSLSTDDYIELWVANETSTGNLTIKHGNLSVVEIG